MSTSNNPNRSNAALPRLPETHTISRRPILHPAIADIHAGPTVAKCVYVSRRTPLMGAVKRVKKLLAQIEKRASDRARGEKGSARQSRGSGPPSVEQVNAVLARDREEVLVKASGRAMQQALKVGEWFRDREKDVICGVDVRHGNVTVVDDIVEVPVESESEAESDAQAKAEGQESEVLDPGETTLELMGDATVTTIIDERPDTDHADKDPQDEPQQEDSSLLVKKTRKRKRRKRPVYDPDDLPEARMRWIKTVEVAIWLKA